MVKWYISRIHIVRIVLVECYNTSHILPLTHTHIYTALLVYRDMHTLVLSLGSAFSVIHIITHR